MYTIKYSCILIFAMVVALFGANELESVKEYLSQCDKGNADACVEASIYYYEQNNTEKFHFLSAKGCDGDNGEGCFGLGLLDLSKGNYDSAIANFTKSCELDFLDGCLNLASLYITSDNPKEYINKIISLLTKACDGDLAMACTNLGVVYLGNGGYEKVDAIKARELIKKGCDGGDDEGCKALEAVEKTINNSFEKSNNESVDEGNDFWSFIASIYEFFTIKLPQFWMSILFLIGAVFGVCFVIGAFFKWFISLFKRKI